MTITSPQLQLFDTKTRKKEKISPADGKKIRMYTCGPTVYNFAHIGNLRTYIFEDLLRRTIKFLGMEIEQVMNLTDVDDKTIRGANEKGISLDQFTAPFKKAFFEDLRTLHIEPVEHYPAATDYVAPMIKMIEQLLNKGAAYQGKDKSIYFSINKFPNYGELSHLHLDELEVGGSERISNDEYDKDNVADFVLWKSYDTKRDGNTFWESPFGPGRPGWHLECSTMAMDILGETIDIHCGGVDNIFPHHENEIAQSESCSGKPFSRHWVHSEHLIVNNKKMSKSLGNFYTLRDLMTKGFSGREVRYMLLQTHHKTQLNFTFEGLNAARVSLERLQDFIFRLEHLTDDNPRGKLQPLLEKAEKTFVEALADDLNISVALSALFNLLREVNTLCDEKEIGQDEKEKLLKTLKEFNKILALLEFDSRSPKIPQEVEEALEKRQKAREEKNWEEADKMRDFIQEKGFLIEDSPTGARLKKQVSHS